MLRYDMSGKIIPLSRLGKTFGGDIDGTNGIPANVEIPTTGDYAGVTVSNFLGDEDYSKTIKRTTAGKAAVAATNYFLVKGRHLGFHLKAHLIGGGSGASSGKTNRSIKIGFLSNNAQYDAYLEYRDPTQTDPGTYITVHDGGTITRHPITYFISNPDSRFPVEVWLTRAKEGEDWYFTIAQDGLINTQINLGQVAFPNKYLKPTVEWDWPVADGTFDPSVARFEFTIYRRF